MTRSETCQFARLALANTFRRTLIATACLLISCAVMAHTPQDAIDAVHISPDYENDETVFVIVQNYLLRSVNRGASWKQLVSGLDSPHVLSDISLSPSMAEDGTLFVSTDGGGIYRSVDRGETWRRFNTGLSQLRVGMIHAIPEGDGPKLLAAGSTRGLFVSPTSGADWQRAMSDDVQITALRSARTESTGVVLAGDSAGGIWQSQDNLRDWQRIFEVEDAGAITALSVQPASNLNDVIYIGTELSGLLKTVDGGASFQRLSQSWPAITTDCLARSLPKPIPDTHVRDIEIVDAGDDGSRIFITTWNRAVHVSSDAGESWQLQEEGISCDNQADSYATRVPHFRDFEAGSSLQTDMFAAGFDGLYRSLNGGQSWVQLETLPVTLIRGMDVSASANDQYNLAVTTYGGGAYLSTDFGANWNIVNQGLVTTRLADIEFSSADMASGGVFALSKERLLTRTQINGGWDAQSLVYRGWRRRVGAGLERRLGFSADYGTRLFLSDAERRRVWPMQIELSPDFASDRTMLVGLRQHGVWVSEDGGESWDRDWTGPINFVTALQVSPNFPSDKTAFAGLRGSGIYVTRNGGGSWEAANEGFQYLEEIQATESPNYYIDPPLYTAIKDVLLVVSPNHAEDRTVFASSASGLFRSLDGAQSWSLLSVDASLDGVPANALGISPAFGTDATIVVSFKGRGLYRSTDGGSTFQSIGQDLLDQNFDLKLIEFSPDYAADGTIYGATDEALLRSKDSGLTWTTIDRPIRYEDWRGEDRGPIRFIGEWRRESDPGFSASTQTVSDQEGAQATLNFNGSAITWFAERGPDGGQAIIQLDGETVSRVDLYNGKKIKRAEILRLTGLEPGPHNILITVSASRNMSSTGQRVALDGFDVLSP